MKRAGILAVLVLLAAAIYIYAFFPARQFPEIPGTTVSIPTEGYEEVGINILGNTLSFSAQCRQVSMEITETQAISIKSGLEGKVDTRPSTHDIMKEMLENFGIEIIQARIESYSDGIYYAKIFAAKDNKVLELDARPSDAAGIAVRTGAKMYFRKDLLESSGINTC